MFFICNFKMTEEFMKFPIKFRKFVSSIYRTMCRLAELQHWENTILNRDLIHLGKFPFDFSCISTAFLTTSGHLTHSPNTEQNLNIHWL